GAPPPWLTAIDDVGALRVGEHLGERRQEELDVGEADERPHPDAREVLVDQLLLDPLCRQVIDIAQPVVIGLSGAVVDAAPARGPSPGTAWAAPVLPLAQEPEQLVEAVSGGGDEGLLRALLGGLGAADLGQRARAQAGA